MGRETGCMENQGARGTTGNHGEPRVRRAGLVHVPEECSGLHEAIAAHRGGDPEALERWHAVVRPQFVRALIRGGLDPSLADDAVQRVVEEAFLVAAAGRTVVSELAWSATVVRTVKVRRVRERRRLRSLDDVTAHLVAADSTRSAERREEIDRVRTAIAELPPPYRQALELQVVSERTVAQVASYLLAWRGVGFECTRKILAGAREMLAARLRGEDLRRRWPRRFRKSDWWSTRPPEFPAHEGDESERCRLDETRDDSKEAGEPACS